MVAAPGRRLHRELNTAFRGCVPAAAPGDPISRGGLRPRPDETEIQPFEKANGGSQFREGLGDHPARLGLRKRPIDQRLDRLPGVPLPLMRFEQGVSDLDRPPRVGLALEPAVADGDRQQAFPPEEEVPDSPSLGVRVPLELLPHVSHRVQIVERRGPVDDFRAQEPGESIPVLDLGLGDLQAPGHQLQSRCGKSKRQGSPSVRIGTLLARGQAEVTLS